MQLADETAFQALIYVELVAKYGHRLTVEEFEAYVVSPDRRPGRTTSPIAEPLAQIQRNMVQSVFGGGGKTIPGESILAWLTRLRWLRTEGGHVYITPLGRAVRRALEETGRDEELPTEIILDPSDELSYPRIIGAIAEAGECALVDRYFSIDSLLDVLQRTRLQRLLVGPDHQGKGRVAALG